MEAQSQEYNNSQPRQYYQFEFTGSAGEFFKVWIVNVLLTVATLGIYSAWAKVRTNRYFYGNTLLDGSAFDYTADPVRILVGRLIAVALIVIYQVSVGLSTMLAGWVLVIGVFIVPPIIVMSMRFRTRYSSWRGINFGFKPDFLGAYLLFSPVILIVLAIGVANILFGGAIDEQAQTGSIEDKEILQQLGIVFVVVAVLMLLGALLFPFWQCRYYHYIGNRVRYGASWLRFNASAWDFYAIYFGAFFVTVGAFFALFVVVFIIGLLIALISGGANFNTSDGIGSAILGLIAILFIQALVKAYVQTRRTNIIYSHLEVEDICFVSELRVRRMLYLYLTNTLAIVLSLGLAIPWAKIRVAQYRAETMRLLASNFDQFVSHASQEVDAKADAVSDLFDFDLGL